MISYSARINQAKETSTMNSKNQAMRTAQKAKTPELIDMEAWKFVRHFRQDAQLRALPAARERFDRLTSQSSVCSYCGVGCPYAVEADKKGRPVVVPMSALGLCIKGKTSLMTGGLTERRQRLEKRKLPDDRITSPMIRGHDGKMHPVSWEKALDRAAWLFLHAREWVGPDAVGLYGNGQKTLEAIWMASLYKLVFKMPTIGANSEHCLASAGAAHELNFGNEASFTWQEFEELDFCDIAVLHGTNPYITFPQAYEKLKRNPHPIKVVIDPVATDTVSDLKACDERTLHIRFQQGCDVLFNLAVSRVILEEGWEDREYLQRVVDIESLQAFRELVMEDRCEPSSVAHSIVATGDDPAHLEKVIRDYAALISRPSDHSSGQRPKVAFVSSMGINQSTGSYGFSTNLNLLLLTGNVGRKGAGSLRIAGQSNATSELMMGFNSRRLLFNMDPHCEEHREALADALDLPISNIPSGKGTPVSHMCEDDRLYWFLFVGTQMTKNMPRLGHWMRRMGRAFNVVIDPFLADGVLEWADVLLPSMTYTERTGVIQRGDRTLQLQQRLTEPPENAWSDEQILARLALAIAKRLQDPDTAQLNDLSPDVVERTFAKYVDDQGDVDSSKVFDHIVEVSGKLNLYSKLVDQNGLPISHLMLRDMAGIGVQWQGNGRYQKSSTDGHVFPRLQHPDRGPARLVRPPDDYLVSVAPLPKEGSSRRTASSSGPIRLISGRGRPGMNGMAYRGRYNSGIKTLPIYGVDAEEYFVEIHPDLANARGVGQGQLVRLSSGQGSAVAIVSLNDRTPLDAVFMDFVPGEINRLTDYVESDAFTNQSLIKRTSVNLHALTSIEQALWNSPDTAILKSLIDTIYQDYRKHFPLDEKWAETQQVYPPRHPWPAEDVIRLSNAGSDPGLAAAIGAFMAFIQRYVTSKDYRKQGCQVLGELDSNDRWRLLSFLLPLLRRLDFQSALHTLLSDLTGGIVLVDEDGKEVVASLLSAHKSAILEFKEEIVAIQLFVAIKRGIEMLFGTGAKVERERLAFVSGIAIPCAGDVPAHFVDISPADLDSDRLIHSRAIGSSSIMVVDRWKNRAVRVDVKTGILPRDRELTLLRNFVINRKRGATTQQHNRFFDRLGELIVQYIRSGDENFDFFGPEPLDWKEYVGKIHIAPAAPKKFREYLVEKRVKPELAESLGKLGVHAVSEDPQLIAALSLAQQQPEIAVSEIEEAPTLQGRVQQVVETMIEPILNNDGGKLEVLDINEEKGEVVIRFVGSCANCPYSLLSMENIVKPSLLSVRGVTHVVHRARVRAAELNATSDCSPLMPNGALQTDLSELSVP